MARGSTISCELYTIDLQHELLGPGPCSCLTREFKCHLQGASPTFLRTSIIAAVMLLANQSCFAQVHPH